MRPGFTRSPIFRREFTQSRSTASGFKKFESTNNKLDPSSTLEVNASCNSARQLKRSRFRPLRRNCRPKRLRSRKLVTREQIDALELNGRNPVGLASLVPGARGGNLSGLSFNFNQGPSDFNGSRNPENLITYDGAPATRTRSNGTSLGAADVDSTSEVQILTADYAAEYGRTSGAQIRIVTRAGGSDFHGAGYEYFRNNDLNANTWTRNHTTGSGLRSAVPLQPVRIQRRRTVLHPGKIQQGQEQVFLVLGPGMGSLSLYG